MNTNTDLATLKTDLLAATILATDLDSCWINIYEEKDEALYGELGFSDKATNEWYKGINDYDFETNSWKTDKKDSV